jgi:hypothetical protein
VASPQVRDRCPPELIQQVTLKKQGWLRLLGQKFFRDKWICLSG